MSAVVLRCPACGTTQTQPGECDACSEGEVRYFCSNHSPGRWLDGAVCKECGVRFGDTPRSRPELTPRAAPTTPIRETTRRAASRPPSGGDAGTPRTDSWKAPSAADRDDTPDTPSLAELLVHTLEERERARHEAEEVLWREPAAAAPSRSLPVGGCLVRLVLFVLLLVALGLAGFFLLIGGLL